MNAAFTPCLSASATSNSLRHPPLFAVMPRLMRQPAHKGVMPDLIRHLAFAVDSGARGCAPGRNDSFGDRFHTPAEKRPALIYLLLAALLVMLRLPALAEVPRPAIEIAKPGSQCIAPREVMRRQHPDLLRHQRVLTVHEGHRANAPSLNGCIDCHADRQTGSVLGKQGFCQSCHSYAGVNLECFECHRATLSPRLAAANPP